MGDYVLGGHVGFLPIPELELGYGLQYSRVEAGVDSWMQSVDLNYVRTSELLRGQVRVNAQWIWSQVGRVAYDAGDFGGTAGNTFSFSNHRDGGYAQIAYRPTPRQTVSNSSYRVDLLRHCQHTRQRGLTRRVKMRR